MDGRVVDSGYPSTQTILFCPEDKMQKHPTALDLTIVGLTALFLGLILVVSLDQTYEVRMTWPDRQVVAVYDGHGNKVDPAKVDLKKLRYEVVWVAPDDLR